MKIQGYRMVSCYSRPTMEHGGACIYADTDMDFTDVDRICQKSIEGVVEFACAVDRKIKLVVLCVYRRGMAPFENFMERMEEVLNILVNSFLTFKIVIGGDFNINLFDKSEKVKQFMDVIHVFNFHQCILEATRVTTSSATLIDNIFFNSEVSQVAFSILRFQIIKPKS